MAVPKVTRGTQNDYRNSKKLSNLHVGVFMLFLYVVSTVFVQKHLPTIRDLQKESFHSKSAQIEKFELFTECSTNLMFSHHGTKMSKLICWWYFDGIKFMRAMERSCK
eukprot:TRINITY_DN7920_c0_g1_i1.p1 TRINITY_DN7920_c0_g1~~TRINITY_DN7920_c0_g1_i1.p1  ORF type:complete len:108 (-),score=4.94 TRINITY_DN7920_c0_g1_i1:993-1316(-)